MVFSEALTLQPNVLRNFTIEDKRDFNCSTHIDVGNKLSPEVGARDRTPSAASRHA